MAESQSESQAIKSKSQNQSQSQSATRDLPAPADDHESENESKNPNGNADSTSRKKDGSENDREKNGNDTSKAEKTGRKIKLPVVLWKTWLYRKHHFCCFGAELLIPVLLCVIFYFLISSVRRNEYRFNKELTKQKYQPLSARKSEVLIQQMLQTVFTRQVNPEFKRASRALRFEDRFQNPQKEENVGHIKFVMAYAPQGVEVHDEIMNLTESFLDNYVKETDGNVSVECRGFGNEREIEDFFKKWDLANPKKTWLDYGRPSKPGNQNQNETKPVNKERFVGAFILDFPKGGDKWSYKLRLIDEYYFSKYDTLKFYPHASRDTFPDPNKGRPSYPKAPHYENFVGLQVLMDLMLLNQVDGGASVPNISLGALPNPTPIGGSGNLVSWWYFYGPFLACSMSFLCILIQTVRGIASEKETGFKEILKVHGLGHWVNLLGWAFSTIFVIDWGATLITLTFMLGFLKYTNGFMFWITMFCYGLQIMAIAFFIASICTKALFATILGFIVWLAGLAVGLLLVSTLSGELDSDYSNEVYVEMGKVEKFFLSVIFPEAALSFAFNVFMGYEKRQVPSSWSRLYEPFAGWDNSSIGFIWAAMLVSIFFYIVLGTYLENILPSNYGARKPIFYPFYKSTWCRGSSSKIEPKEKEKEKLVVQKSGGAFEPDPVGLTPGVSIYELTKVYGKKTVVDGVSLHIYQGQITVLLGHNGAGKSTLVSMVTGLTNPTKGTAVIQGCDIRKDLDGAQTSMSICPQENMQSSTFSVMEHLRLFALLKGSSFAKSKAQAEEWATKLKLAEKKTTAANKLSGGMRRRLQLGMSLIGGNHVVFLDEPSSGLDPQTRRDVWDILMNYRGNSTIVLSTHYMEEADVLGDRIVIMRGGQFQCCGSPLFLKGIYGIGYTLHVTINRPNAMSQNQTPTVSPTGSKTNSQIPTERKGSKKASKETIKTTTAVARRKSSRKNVTSSNSNPGLNKEENDTNAEILSLVKSHFPNARIVKATSKDNNSSTRQLDINIPQATTKTGASNSNFPTAANAESSEPGPEPENGGKTIQLNNTSKFSVFFKDLESNSSKLGIAHSSLTFTTLDDVFEKAGAQVYSSEKEGENEGVMKMDELESIQVDKQNLGCRQFRAFLLKKLGITTRKWGILVFQLFFPAFFMILALIMVSLGYSGYTKPGPNVKMSLTDFTRPVVSFTSTSPNLTRHFKSLVGASSPQEFKSSLLMEKELNSAISKDPGFYTFHNILAADLKEKDENLFVTVYASQMAVHSQPLAINIATNTILKAIRQRGKSNNNNNNNGYSLSQLSVSNQALRRNKTTEQDRKRIQDLNPESGDGRLILDSFTDIFGLFLVLGLIPVVVTFIFVPAQEKVTEWKHLQVQMTGASPASYWAAFFIVDFFLLVLIFVVLLALVPIFRAFDAYTPFMAENGLGALFLILVSFGYSTLCLGYFASSRAKSATSTIVFFILFHIFIIFACFFVYILILMGGEGRGEDKNGVDIIAAMVFQFFPSVNFFFSLFCFHLQAKRNIACGRIENLLAEQCKIPEFAENPLHICCPDCKKNCIKVEPYLKGVAFEDVGRLVLMQIAVGTFFLLLLIFKESRVAKKCCKKGKNSKKNPGNSTAEQNLNSDPKLDEDVIAEIERVKMQVEEKKRMEEGDSFFANQMSKAFKNFQAVKNVTFGVRKDQCFGLLGPNGCGKTTMFRMLAGQEIPDTGNAYINLTKEGQDQDQSGGGDLSCNLQQSEQKFLSNIGYCPQFDAFSGYLTGKEMLLLMGRLRGVEEKSVSKVADQWLLQMGLEKSAKVQCRKYSGGMKRKLSTALSLIGGPKLVFLDEPSTGVDPHARRQFWKVLASAQKAGQSIVLTSHSMEECEALCSSLCIMINGKMQCLGGVEHLKHKYAIGHDLTIKLTVRIPPRPEIQGNPNAPNQNQSQGQPNQNTSAPISNSNVQGQQNPPSGPAPESSVSNSYWNLPQVQELLKLKESIQQGFAPCILKDEHENILQYQIQNTLMPWSSLFQTMEEIKERHKSLIQEYTLQETTLEQVFLSIARMQITREVAKANCCKRFCLTIWDDCCS